jgi:hypothetical protein
MQFAFDEVVDSEGEGIRWTLAYARFQGGPELADHVASGEVSIHDYFDLVG